MVTETGGTWGRAQRVPGLAALNRGGLATIDAVSCATADSCAAGGEFEGGSDNVAAFVVDETRGKWDKATKVPGSAVLNVGGGADVESISCPADGDCTAIGAYTNGGGNSLPFIVSQRKGSWGRAIKVPGLAALNHGVSAAVTTVSCPVAGDCTAGGDHTASSGQGLGYVVSERNESWGRALEVPGQAILLDGASGGIASVSCVAPGSCGAIGFSSSDVLPNGAFVVSQVRARWGKATAVPGFQTFDKGRPISIGSLSCSGPGTCFAGGAYEDRSKRNQAFVVSQVHGSWGKAIEMPGTAALNLGSLAYLNSISCVRSGICAATGTYMSASGQQQVFVATKG